MNAIHSHLPEPHQLENAVESALESAGATLRLAAAYQAAHARLALADVVVRAALAFTKNAGADDADTLLENVFDACKKYMTAVSAEASSIDT